jgi:hypothetical protein
MRKKLRTAIIGTAAAGSLLLGAGAAMAASSGSFSLSVSGASASGTYKYNVKPNVPSYPGTGIQYAGTLKNTGTTDANTAYFYAKVEGYGWTQLASAASRGSTTFNKVVYDPAALYVRRSQAQVCRDRTALPQSCEVKTYNYS